MGSNQDASGVICIVHLIGFKDRLCVSSSTLCIFIKAVRQLYLFAYFFLFLTVYLFIYLFIYFDTL